MDVYIFEATRREISLPHYALFYEDGEKGFGYAPLSPLSLVGRVVEIHEKSQEGIQVIHNVPPFNKVYVINLLETEVFKFSDIRPLDDSKKRIVLNRLREALPEISV